MRSPKEGNAKADRIVRTISTKGDKTMHDSPLGGFDPEYS